MLKRELYGIARESLAELDNGISLEYYLLEDTEIFEAKTTVVFGVEVVQVTKRDNIYEEKDAVKSVWTNRDSAECFIQRLVDCKVMPIHLRDVIRDFAEEEFNDKLKTA